MAGTGQFKSTRQALARRWKQAVCPSCGKTVWFTEPIAVATVPTAFAHLVPQTTMGECGHTVSVRFLNKPGEFEAVNRAMFERQQAAMAGASLS